MSFTLYMNELYEMFNDVSLSMQNGTAIDRVEKKIPSSIGSGHTSVDIVGEVLFSKNNYNFNTEVKMISNDYPSIEDNCYFILTPEGRNQFTHDNKREEYHFSKNSINFGFIKQGDIFNTKFDKGCTEQYSLSFSKETILDYLQEFDNAKLINQVEKADSFDIFKNIKLSPSQHYLMNQIKNNPYHGSLKKLHLETSVNNLLFSLLKDVSANNTYDLVLSQTDKIQLHKAKEILLQNIHNPPSIEELSKLVSTNSNKLKRGFKTLFGNTIYKTLTKERMKIAYANIQKNDMSVGEIAYFSGYENVSNFIAVFKKEFGMTPGEMRKSKKYYFNYLT